MEQLESDKGIDALADALVHTRGKLDACNEPWAADASASVSQALTLLLGLHSYVTIQNRMIELQDLLIQRARLDRDAWKLRHAALAKQVEDSAHG